MIFCNPVPIAGACLMGSDVVTDTLSALFLAITDLIKQGKNLDIAFGFGNLRWRFNHRKFRKQSFTHIGGRIDARQRNRSSEGQHDVGAAWHGDRSRNR